MMLGAASKMRSVADTGRPSNDGCPIDVLARSAASRIPRTARSALQASGTGTGTCMGYFCRFGVDRVIYFAAVHGSGSGRFYCKSLLKVVGGDDSVSLERFAKGTDDDGAAQSRPEAAVLRVLPR